MILVSKQETGLAPGHAAPYFEIIEVATKPKTICVSKQFSDPEWYGSPKIY